MKRCSTCGNSYDPNNIQETHPFRHPVSGALFDSTKDQEEPDTKQGVKDLPSDPVLRMALIRKGIITATDLTEVEQELEASGVAMSQSQRETRSHRASSDDASEQMTFAQAQTSEQPPVAPPSRMITEEPRTCHVCLLVLHPMDEWQQQVHEGKVGRVVKGHRACIEEKYGKVDTGAA